MLGTMTVIEDYCRGLTTDRALSALSGEQCFGFRLEPAALAFPVSIAGLVAVAAEVPAPLERLLF